MSKASDSLVLKLEAFISVGAEDVIALSIEISCVVRSQRQLTSVLIGPRFVLSKFICNNEPISPS